MKIKADRPQAWMAEEGGEESLLAMIGADPKQLAEAGDLDSPRNSTGWDTCFMIGFEMR